MSTLSVGEVTRMRPVSMHGLDPFPWYKHMRATDPVHLDEQYPLCEVFRYDDICYVMEHPELFSSEWNLIDNHVFKGMMLFLDPPRHHKIRKLVAKAFTPRAIAQQHQQIQNIVNDLLDTYASNGQMDVMTDLAYPLPVTVIAEMLGIPLEDRDQFKLWSDAIASDSMDVARDAKGALGDYLLTITAQRRREPQEDVVSALLSAHVDGESLSEKEIVEFCILLLLGGSRTTTNMIGNAVICLDDHPAAKERLWANPALIPGAMEEVLRFLSPLQRLTRRVTQDTVLGGKQLKAGQAMFIWMGSAGRDEEHFPDADVFDITRKSSHLHIAFGHDIHFCIGAPLARLEAKIAFETLIGRYSSIERIREYSLEMDVSIFGYGVEHLPIRLQKR